MQYLCQELQIVAERVFKREAKEYDLLINIPPGTTKSTICTIMFPVWCWIRDNEKKEFDLPTATMRFITGSHSADLALKHSTRSRDILWHNKFESYFPELEIRQDREAKSNYENTHGGERYSTSTGSSALGNHAHFIIVDDPIDPRQAMAKTRSEVNSANDWIDRTLSQRKVDRKITPIIMIMQRLCQGDPSEHMLGKGITSPVKHICLPATVSVDIKPVELRDKYIDGFLDINRLPKTVLDNAFTDVGGSIPYAGQFMQRPAPEGGAMFKVGNFKLVDQTPHPTEFVQYVRYWDKAATEGDGCNTAGVLMGRTKDNKCYVLDCIAAQMSSDNRNRRIKQTAELDGVNVEVWNEQEPGSGGKESAEFTTKDLIGFNVHSERPTGSKIARAEPLAAAVEAGLVYLVRGEWRKSFIDEYEIFPNGAFKDRVDAGSGAFNKCFGKKAHVGVW